NGLDKDTAWRIEDIYFVDTSTGYAVTLANRIFKTKDGGTHWRISNDTTNPTSFRSVEFLDDKATGLVGGVSANPAILLTNDSGNTWINIASRIVDSTGAKKICGISHYGNTFYAVGSWDSKIGKLYKSTDKGTTWQTHYFDTNLITSIIDVCFLSQDTGFVTGRLYSQTPPLYKQCPVILKTNDGGSTWHTVMADTIFGGYIWKIQFVTRNYAVAALENVHYRDSVVMYRSLNGGDDWHAIAVGNKLNLPNPNGGTNITQACGFATPAHGWVGGYYQGLFETTDSGKTWKYFNFGYDFNRIFVIDSNHVFAGGNVPYKFGTGINLNVPQGNYQRNPLHVLYPISPNPAKGNVKIEFDLVTETGIVLDVVHLDSRRTFRVTSQYLGRGRYSFNWDNIDAPPGNYLIWLGNNEAPLTQKFVLLK
ncbi:MAG: hypothetical protein K8F30_10815, partial [Taibaiella sp.]|nr:hypothetical protein [Taibaiella sp.]